MSVDIDAVARDLREEHSVTAPGLTPDRALDGTGGDFSGFVVQEISFLYHVPILRGRSVPPFSVLYTLYRLRDDTFSHSL